MWSKLKSLWSWIKGLFVKSASGSIWSVILGSITSKTVSILTDADLQKLAWNTAVALHKDDSLSTAQKAVAFNKAILAYVVEHHLTVTNSAINLYRELAVQAIAVKEENGERVETLQ